MNWWPQTALKKSSYGLLKCEYINKSKLATKGPQVKVARMVGFQKVLEDQKISGIIILKMQYIENM